MLRRTSPVNIWDLDIRADKHSDSFVSTHTWAQITEHPIHSPLSPPISHIFTPSIPNKEIPAFTSVLSNKETFTLSHTYFLLRKSYCATQTLYLSQTNTHFTNTEHTAVTVSPVSSRITMCLFYSWSITCSGRSSPFYTENSHLSSHTVGHIAIGLCTGAELVCTRLSSCHDITTIWMHSRVISKLSLPCKKAVV